MKARFLPPRVGHYGNLVWRREEFVNKNAEISSSLKKLRSLGYWASAFPEGNGVTFSAPSFTADEDDRDILEDFRNCFDWIDIEQAQSHDSNTEIAELETDNRTLDCTIIIPLEKIYIQKTLTLGKYTYFCRKEFDQEPYERLSDLETEYVQFNCKLNYRDLLRLNRTIDHNDYVINKCLSLAEHALDIIRYSHSSFKNKAFTPNPAGQRDHGFYDVEIIPSERTHLKPLKLSGISKPLSVSNNWLGPQVDDLFYPGTHYLAAIYNEEITNEISSSVISSLRSCRQSFYSIGSESQFLNLLFTLDGLADPEKKWTGWKHRSYIAALICERSPHKFHSILEEFDRIYNDIRNKLVHEGRDFYQIPDDPDDVSETIYCYIKTLIQLIADKGFSNKSELKQYAMTLLKEQIYKDKCHEVVQRVPIAREKKPEHPSW
ncbi:hypothetical protein G7021_07500 [Pseudomonas carnis]|uniref:hypothetical protein n=1 Tax=Pseudomonas TaxID=286 RepID=UPI000CD124C8|nr:MULTISPECIES: hypothetical protein [Pseudomonas]MBA1252502.1 hypothetical protein [Pseudomonas carnis]MBA1268416.1 hypothetical protein [Pseudomonas carnis]PNY77095.1 hypothetical protein C1751_10775 [Pseudomonas fluorescens]